MESWLGSVGNLAGKVYRGVAKNFIPVIL